MSQSQAVAIRSSRPGKKTIIASENAARDPADIGKFQTPLLRNVAPTALYMRDGECEHAGVRSGAGLYGRGDGVRRPIVLTADERGDIIEFLRALNSSKPATRFGKEF